MGAIAQRGVTVRVLTNALETNDVGLVHAGYAPKRKALLRAGVQLFELRHPPFADPETRKTPRILGSGSGSGSGGMPVGSGSAPRSSISTLHAKTFAVDAKRLFVGSFNFDPRSVHLNTELGFVIDAPALARPMVEAFGDEVPLRAYQVVLSSDGSLNWIERDGQHEIRHTVEPGTTWSQRLSMTVLGTLPIEWLL